MKKADYIKDIITKRGKEFYNENKSLLDAQFEYIQSLGEIKDIKKQTTAEDIIISTN